MNEVGPSVVVPPSFYFCRTHRLFALCLLSPDDDGANVLVWSELQGGH